MAQRVTVGPLVRLADDIGKNVASDKYDIPGAVGLVGKIYEQGLKLVRAETASKPILDGFATPVMLTLKEVASQELIQHEFPFHKAFCKTYRVFIELTWFQCWQTHGLKVSTESRDQVIASVNRMRSILPNNMLELKFEYSCSLQAAKSLNLSEIAMGKYVDAGLDLGEAIESTSVVGAIKALKSVFSSVKGDQIKMWYPDVFILRWLATLVKTKKDFAEQIGTDQQVFEKEGRKHTQCLATIYRDLLKDSEVNDETKELAFEGFDRLLKLKEQGRTAYITDRLNQAAEKIKQDIVSGPIKWATKKWDKYYKTRLMVMEYLAELADDKQYHKWIGKIVKTLQASLPELKLDEGALSNNIEDLRTYLEQNPLTRGEEDKERVAEFMTSEVHKQALEIFKPLVQRESRLVGLLLQKLAS